MRLDLDSRTDFMNNCGIAGEPPETRTQNPRIKSLAERCANVPQAHDKQTRAARRSAATAGLRGAMPFRAVLILDRRLGILTDGLDGNLASRAQRSSIGGRVLSANHSHTVWTHWLPRPFGPRGLARTLDC